MCFGDVVNQFHHVYGFTYAGTTEQTYFTAFGKRTQQVNHFNACFQQLGSSGQLIEFRSCLMDGTVFVGINRTCFINRRTQHIDNTSQSTFTYRYSNRRTCIAYSHAAFQTVRTTHCNSTNHAVAQKLLYFQSQAVCIQFQGVVNMRNGIARKLHVNYRTNNLYDFALAHYRILISCSGFRRH